MKDENKSPSPRRAIRHGALAAILAWGVMILLFGVLAGRWLIAGLAGFCCAVGMFLCFFARAYLKDNERVYRERAKENANPANQENPKKSD